MTDPLREACDVLIQAGGGVRALRDALTDLTRERDKALAVASRRLTELEAIAKHIDDNVPGGFCGDSVSSAAIDIMRTVMAQRDEARAECERLRGVVDAAREAAQLALDWFNEVTGEPSQCVQFALEAALAAEPEPEGGGRRCGNCLHYDAQSCAMNWCQCGAASCPCDGRDWAAAEPEPAGGVA